MISIKNLTISYKDKKVFDGFNLDINSSSIVCLLGVSGCGKTSLLNAIARNVNYGGTIEGAESVSYLFQQDRLIPSMTVLNNVLFACSHLFKDKKIAKDKAMQVLESVGLKGYENRYPDSLSGGQSARVALARAFCYPSQVLLMDEPFQGLDIVTKHKITQYFLQLFEKTNKTVVVVSHSIDEVVELADRVIVLGDSPCKVLCDISIELPRGERDCNPVYKQNVVDKIKSCLLSI